MLDHRSFSIYYGVYNVDYATDVPFMVPDT